MSCSSAMAILLPSTSALLSYNKVSHVWVAIIPVTKNNHLNVLKNGNIRRHCVLTKARTSREKDSDTAESVEDENDKTNPDNKPEVRRINTAKKPSVAEIERAIGAGIFKDRDINRESSEQEKTLFDSILSNSIGRKEGDVEKKLRETGEWIIDKTEGPSRSTGKNILKVVFLWILPLWIVSFLVASGAVKLPIISPFLDDLLM